MYSLSSLLTPHLFPRQRVKIYTFYKFITALISFYIIVNSAALQAQELEFKTSNTQYQLQLVAPETPALNTIYLWKAVIKSDSVSLNKLTLADLAITGGMLAHGHGLPTQPKAMNLSHNSANQISFDIQGLKFQMWGKWHVQVSIMQSPTPLIAYFELTP